MESPGSRRLFDLIAVALLCICLGFYIAEIKSSWIPNLLRESPVSYKINKYIGTEFRMFWTGSYMALHGELSDIYNNSKFEAVETRLAGTEKGHVWLYPPPFLLMVLPLSLLPFLASLGIWLAVTLSCYLLILRRICPQPHVILWMVFFPGIVINFMVGHNGFLSGTLVGGGLLFINSSPILAGILFGLFFYKPQLGILIPLALLAGRRWNILGITAISAAGIGIASALIFGPDTWLEFLRNLPIAAKLTDSPRFWDRMPTIYAAARAAGNGTLIAWTLQGIMMLGVMAGVYWVWSGKASAASRASILILGILLVTRYAFIYDYAILAIPLAWLWQEGQTTGWLSLEKPLLLYGWVMPAISSLMLTTVNWPLSVLMLPTTIALFILVLRRHYVERGKGQGVTVIDSS
jgi:alpha-1,2-mannosyltransferase